jgi:hypothetical protein
MADRPLSGKPDIGADMAVGPLLTQRDIEQRLMLQERTRGLPYQSTRLSWYDAVS